MTKTELKPCPFCGGKPDLGSYSSSENWIVVCSKCEAETQIYETEREAVKAWNTRQVEDDKVKYESTSYSCRACKNATDSEIKRLREALESIKEMSSYLSAGEITIYDLIGIHNICCDALEGKEE